jgi:predicted nuclease with TOPRIM domain
LTTTNEFNNRLFHSGKSKTSFNALKEDFNDQRVVIEKLKQNLDVVIVENNGIQSQLNETKKQLNDLIVENRQLNEEKDMVINSVDGLSQNIRAMLQSMDNAITDAESRVNLLTAGTVFNSRDESSNHLTNNLSVVENETRNGHHSSNELGFDFGASSLLARSLSSVDRMLNSMLSTISALATEVKTKKSALEKSETVLREVENNFKNERVLLTNRLKKLDDENLDNNAKLSVIDRSRFLYSSSSISYPSSI